MTTLSRRIDQLSNKRAKGGQAKPSDPFARELAKALDWENGSRRIEHIKAPEIPFRLNRGLINQHPAILFAGHRRSDSLAVVKETACFCYHASIHWAVVSNFVETIIINSHWVRNGEWFALPTLSWKELTRNKKILVALTPEGIQSGELNQLAHTFYEPDDVLVSVDDKLVDCLDMWRDEALRHAVKADGVDEKVQTLFAQLFVLRAVEDRRLKPKIPALKSALDGDESLDVKKIAAIFRAAKREIQSELFDAPLPEGLPNFVLAGIIGDLYVTRQFPIDNVKYNFAWIGADVLGRADEK